MKKTLIQFIKFVAVGVVNTGVDWIIYYFLSASVLSGEKELAKIISFLFALLNSYLMNTAWTFKAEYKRIGSNAEARRAVVSKFFLVGLVGWGINALIFALASARFNPAVLGHRDIVALVLASGAAVLWNFFGNKLWTYKK